MFSSIQKTVRNYLLPSAGLVLALAAAQPARADVVLFQTAAPIRMP